jgi:SAM-dependent methyltransferase
MRPAAFGGFNTFPLGLPRSKCKYVRRNVIDHPEAEESLIMDRTLPEPLEAPPADLRPTPDHSDDVPPKTSWQSDKECDRPHVETQSEPDSLANTVEGVASNEPAPELSHQMQADGAHKTPNEPIGTVDAEQQSQGDVLHVGCGVLEAEKLPGMFRHAGWREIRLDIDPNVKPDVIASITDMQIVSDASVDAIYSSHNVEHLYPHEVPLALREMNRVLKPTGFAFIKLPDLQEVARYVAEGKLEDPLYISPVGAIAPLDIIYGHRSALARGNTFMAHRTGFTARTLASALIAAGFVAVMMQRDLPNFALTGIAFRTPPSTGQTETWRARLLPTADRPTVLYTSNS